MTIERAFLAGLAASMLMLAFNGDGFAEKFASLPEAVRQTAEANMKNAFPLSIGSARGEQGWDYQINTRLNGKYHDLVIDNKGKLVAVKDETDLAALPPAAKAALEKQAAASKIVMVEKVTQGGQISYAAVVRNDSGGANVQVRVGADGTLKSQNGNSARK